MIFEIQTNLDILRWKGLFEVACCTVANSLKGKTPEEIRTQFGKWSLLSFRQKLDYAEYHYS